MSNPDMLMSEDTDREWFIRENAVSLLAERDAKISRLKERITYLEKVRCSLKAELTRQRMKPTPSIR